MTEQIKKMATLLLMLVFFTCASGFVITIHQCCKCQHEASHEMPSQSCCDCNSHANEVTHRCKDDVVYVKIQDFFKKNETQIEQNIAIPVILCFIISQNEYYDCATALNHFQSEYPAHFFPTGRAFINFAHQRIDYA